MFLTIAGEAKSMLISLYRGALKFVLKVNMFFSLVIYWKERASWVKLREIVLLCNLISQISNRIESSLLLKCSNVGLCRCRHFGVLKLIAPAVNLNRKSYYRILSIEIIDKLDPRQWSCCDFTAQWLQINIPKSINWIASLIDSQQNKFPIIWNLSTTETCRRFLLIRKHTRIAMVKSDNIWITRCSVFQVQVAICNNQVKTRSAAPTEFNITNG